ncbi:MAG: HD domain-containing protein [Actinomycetota bacterium]|nr:HD domain-containing protein [Actinomycetota bacterium]
MTPKRTGSLAASERKGSAVHPRPDATVRRIAVAGMAIVAVITLALGISTWRSQAAARFASIAISDHERLTVAATGRDLLFDEGNILVANRRLTAAQETVLSADQRAFSHALVSAPRSPDPRDAEILADVGAVNDQLVARQHATELELGGNHGAAALRRSRQALHAVDLALDTFVAYNTRDAKASQAQSNVSQQGAVSVARWVGGLAVLLAISLVTYVITLVKRFVARIQADAGLLEQKVHDVERARLETLERLALASEYRDDDTMHHTQRVGSRAAVIAERMGLAAETVELIRLAAPLHDIGKLGISDTILLKPGPLTPEERETMKTHTLIGALILARSRSPVLRLAEQIALSHHERWDGDGYPHQIAGEAIPISARIVAVADVYDALTHDRPYKHAWPADQALAVIKQEAGGQFDPQVVTAFLSTHPEQIPSQDTDADLALAEPLAA